MTCAEGVVLSRSGAQPPAPSLVRALLTGAPPDSVHSLPPAYVVVVFCAGTPRGAEELATALRSRVGALSLLSPRGGYVLLPCPVARQAADVVRALHATVSDAVWMGHAWGLLAELPLTRALAADVVRVVLAGGRSRGVYELRDVLSDISVLRQPAVSARLMRMIEPVVARSSLVEALRALLAEDGNRARAARRLRIHRSTLDYRLRTVERMTGTRPTSPQGLLTLDAALTAHALASVPPFLPSL